MGDFDKFAKEIVPTQAPANGDWENLPHDMAMCSECGWSGPISICDTYEDSEGWEYPNSVYTVICCPICSLGSEDGLIEYTYSSIEAAIEVAYHDTMDYDPVNE